MKRARVLSEQEAEQKSKPFYWWLLVVIFFEYARPASYFPPLGLVPLNSLLPLMLLVAVMFAPGMRPWNSIFSDRFSKWPFILVGVVLVSMFWATVMTYSYVVFERILGYLFLCIMITRIVTTRERIHGVFITLAVAHLFLLLMNPAVVLNPDTRHYVAGATFLGDGNDFSLSLCIILGMALSLLFSRKSKWSKLLCWALVGVVMLSIVGTQSRGATLGMAAVFGYLWWLSPRKAVGVVAILVAATGVLMYAPAVYFERLGTLSAPTEDGSAEGRLQAWTAGARMAADNVLGVGAGNFPNNFPKYRSADAPVRWMTAHSMYFLILGELGILGLLMLFKLVFGNFRANGQLRQRLRKMPDPPVNMAGDITLLNTFNAAILGFAVAGTFLSVTYYPHIFVLGGLGIALRRLIAEEAGLPVEATRTAARGRTAKRSGELVLVT